VSEQRYTITPSAVAGLLLVLLGTLFLLDNYSVIDAGAWLRYWPLLLVILGSLKATRPGNTAGRIFGGAVAVIGALMVLNRAGVLHISIGSLWPLILVAIGLSFVLRSGRRKHVAEEITGDSDSVRGSAILGGIEQSNSSKRFSGGSVSAILGGHDLDLREADMPEHSEAVLDVFAFMGGVEIKVPREWTVVVDASAFLGGFENKTSPSQHGLKTLRISGSAVMGGVEIKS
jgi:predicted membrane protein